MSEYDDLPLVLRPTTLSPLPPNLRNGLIAVAFVSHATLIQHVSLRLEVLNLDLGLNVSFRLNLNHVLIRLLTFLHSVGAMIDIPEQDMLITCGKYHSVAIIGPTITVCTLDPLDVC